MYNTYLDYAATTPVDDEVLEVMLPYFNQKFGNPSSVHRHGQQAEGAVESARESIASLLECEPVEIIFTSGGSESDNLAIRGTALARRSRMNANRVLITPVEHEAVGRTARQLQDLYGFKLEYIPVDNFGVVKLPDFKKMLAGDVAIVSAIYGNNEIGTINPINEIGQICSEMGIPFHTDAVQAMGYVEIKAKGHFDLLSAGAHKFYGPKGVGLLYKNRNLKIFPTQTGGAQEMGLRAGTHNVPYIIGIAAALVKTRRDFEKLQSQYAAHRDRIITGIINRIEGATLTGHPISRLNNHASFVINGIDGNQLVMALDIAGYSCSSGSACKTGNPEPSEVLLALGIAPDNAKGSLRVTVGRDTTDEQITKFLEDIPEIISRLKAQ